MVDIRAAGLVKSFDLEKRILDGLSFQVDSGERVGLLGRNGAGKTTVFRMLTGELEPDEGEIQIAAGRRVGLISQIPVYPAGYTVEDVLQTAFARMFRMKDEMDALALRMEQGDSSEATLRRTRPRCASPPPDPVPHLRRYRRARRSPVRRPRTCASGTPRSCPRRRPRR